MTIEVEYFPDKRLKVIRRFMRNDSNVRIEGEKISVVSRLDEARLENEVIEACDLHNLRKRFPEIDKEINQIIRRHFQYEL
jgi:hypothetical protein